MSRQRLFVLAMCCFHVCSSAVLVNNSYFGITVAIAEGVAGASITLPSLRVVYVVLVSVSLKECVVAHVRRDTRFGLK